jgi:hypothetical protein
VRVLIPVCTRVHGCSCVRKHVFVCSLEPHCCQCKFKLIWCGGGARTRVCLDVSTRVLIPACTYACVYACAWVLVCARTHVWVCSLQPHIYKYCFALICSGRRLLSTQLTVIDEVLHDIHLGIIVTDFGTLTVVRSTVTDRNNKQPNRTGSVVTSEQVLVATSLRLLLCRKVHVCGSVASSLCVRQHMCVCVHWNHTVVNVNSN